MQIFFVDFFTLKVGVKIAVKNERDTPVGGQLWRRIIIAIKVTFENG